MESAENANSAVRCSKQMQLNSQSLISAKSYHSLKCLSAHEGLVTHAQKVQIVVGHQREIWNRNEGSHADIGHVTKTAIFANARWRMAAVL